MKQLLMVFCACLILAGCGKATRCDSEFMRGQMKDRFIEDMAEGVPSAGIDLIATGVVANLNFDQIQTDSEGGNGNGAVCSAKLTLTLDGTPFEDEFGYLVVSQDGDDLFRRIAIWPFGQLNALLKKGRIGALLEKEQEIRELETAISNKNSEINRLSDSAEVADIFDKVSARLEVQHYPAPPRANQTGEHVHIDRVTIHVRNDSSETLQTIRMMIPPSALAATVHPVLDVWLDPRVSPGESVSQDVTRLFSWPANPTRAAVQEIETATLDGIRGDRTAYSRDDLPTAGEITLAINTEGQMAEHKRQLEKSRAELITMRQAIVATAGRPVHSSN